MLENARITGLVAAVALSGMVMAQENRPGAGRDSLFPILDKNGDGTLGQGELDLAISSLRKLDRNQDGTISQEELRADQGSGGSPRPGGSPRSGGRGIAAPTWSEIDQDGDGKVSLKEAPERMKGRFDRMDQNGDGFLDKEEQERIDQMFRRMRGGGGQSPEGRGRGRSPRGGGSGSEDVWKILAEKYDKDRNGEISKEEYTRGGEKFTQLDRNEDGKLNEADFLGGRNRGGGRGGRGRGPERDAGAGARSGIPEEGADAPDFELAYASKDGTAKNGRKVKLSSFKGDKPVALVFGSYT